MRQELVESLRASGLFDADWYCTVYADVSGSGFSAWDHFVQRGWKEGRSPGPGFCPTAYLEANPGVAKAGVPALKHYLKWGWREGRRLSSDSIWPETPLPDGLPAWVGHNTDVPAAQGQRILYVLSIQKGGTPQTNQDLMHALNGRAECLVLRCTGQELVLYLFHAGIYVPLANHRLGQPIEPFPHATEEYNCVVASWLAEYSVTLLHIRHLAWQGLGLIAQADRLEIPVVCSFHDYYAVCPSVKLLDENLEFCSGRCTASRGECTHELWAPEKISTLKHESIYFWQQQFARALVLCDGFVTTVHSAREQVLAVFPALEEHPFPVIPHGRNFDKSVMLSECPTPGNELRVLVPGHVGVSKGSLILLELARHPALAHVQWHVLGTLSGVREVSLPENLIVHGAYARDDFASLVAHIRPHLGAVLSLWPETWCHTLTELWSVGVPVLGFDIGAVGERLNATEAGWPVSPITAESVSTTLLEAARINEWQRAMRGVENWQRNGQVSCEQMAADYWQLYQQVLTFRQANAGAR